MMEHAAGSGAIESEFDADTAIRALAPGEYEAIVSDRWNVGVRPNGGYLMAIGVRALADALPHPDPLTVTAHYLRPPQAGEALVRVEPVRSGRRLSVGQASLRAGDREFVRMLAAFGDLGTASGPTVQRASAPALPPPGQCVRLESGMPGATIVERFDVRFRPDTVGWMRDDASGRGEIAAWLRFADGREPDLLSLVQVVDALPPAVFDLGILDPVPTVELTVHLRAHPAPGWLRCLVRTRHLIAGVLEEEAEVWDAEGRLVAQARQLAVLVGPGA